MEAAAWCRSSVPSQLAAASHLLSFHVSLETTHLEFPG